MYAQVVVLTYQAPQIGYYTYEVPKDLEKEIKVGQLVSVPFGKREPFGMILHLRGVLPATPKVISETKIKSISSIVIKNPILLPYQVELLKWMAFYYRAPMVNCLEAMLPEIPKRSINNQTHLRGVKAHPEGEGYQQTLILVPSINRVPETLAKYPRAKNYVIYHNELPPSQRFATWQKILTGNVDHIFGSRSAIFAPCPNLKEIIIYDEHEEGYHDERSPYYNTLTIAEKLQELTGTKLRIIDSSPRITTYFNLGVRPLLGVRPQVQLVNMLDERKIGNRSPLSQLLEDYIKKGLAKNKKILLFLNKKSASGHLYCKNCKYSDFAPKQPDLCPQCQSSDIFFNSTNINSLSDLVKQIVSVGGAIAKGTIEIATAAVFYKLLTQKYDLVAHIQTDSLINITDFASAEKLYSQITSLKKITRGLLLLQTYNPQNLTITSAAQGDWQKFYQSQLAQRKALSFPPFTLLVKLSTKGKKEEDVEQKAKQLFKDLNSQLSTFNSQLLTILGPYKPNLGGKLSKYNIILKILLAGYSLKQREEAVSRTSSLLSKIPKGWQTEVETNSLN